MKKLLAIVLFISVCSPAWGMEKTVEDTAQAAPETSQKIKLESCDGQTFIVDKELISKSITIKNFLEDLLEISEAIPLPIIDSGTLQIIINCLEKPDDASTTIEKLPYKSVIAFTQAIYYLDIPELISQLPVFSWLFKYPGLCKVLGKWERGYGAPAISLNADGSIALTGRSDRTACVWDTNTNTCLQTLTGHQESIGTVALSADGVLAITGSHDKSVRIWNTRTGKCVKTITIDDLVSKVILSAEGKHLFIIPESSSSDFLFVRIDQLNPADNLADLWEKNSLQINRLHFAEEPGEMFIRPRALSGDGKIGASRSGQRVILFDTGTLEVLHTITCASAVQVALSKNGSCALIDSHKKTEDRRILHEFWLVDLPSKKMKLLTMSDKMVTSALSLDGKIAATGGYDYTISLFDTHSGKLLRRIATPFDEIGEAVASIALSQNGTKILAVGKQRYAAYWDTMQPQNLGLNQIMVLTKIWEGLGREQKYPTQLHREQRIKLSEDEAEVFMSLPENIHHNFTGLVELPEK
jgi:WD40 repeat protein